MKTVFPARESPVTPSRIVGLNKPSPNSASARAARRACSTISEISVTARRMWPRRMDGASGLSGHRSGVAQTVEQRGAAHIGSRGVFVLGGPAQLVEICLAHGRIALLHQPLVGDGL